MRLRPAAILSLVAVLIGVTLGYACYRNTQLEKNFPRIHAGLTDKEVLAILGKPSWVEPCGKSFGNLKQNCTQYLYRNSFVPLIPEFYSVEFNNDRHVVDSYVYESP
jgi:hypothetical protein